MNDETFPLRVETRRAPSLNTTGDQGGLRYAPSSGERNGLTNDAFEMPDEGRDSVFPHRSVAGPSDRDDVRELEGAPQCLVVTGTGGAAHEWIALRRDPCSDRRAGQVDQAGDRRRGRKRLGHEGKANLGEANVECWIIEAASGPVDELNMLVVDEGVPWPEVAVDEGPTWRGARLVLVEPVDDARERGLVGKGRRHRSDMPARSSQILHVLMSKFRDNVRGIDTGERLEEPGQLPGPGGEELREIEREPRRLDASQVRPAGDALDDQICRSDVTRVLDAERDARRQSRPGTCRVVQTGLQPCLCSRLHDAKDEAARPSVWRRDHLEREHRRKLAARERRRSAAISEFGCAEAVAQTIEQSCGEPIRGPAVELHVNTVGPTRSRAQGVRHDVEPRALTFTFLAEGVGFEPTETCASTVFKSCSRRPRRCDVVAFFLVRAYGRLCGGAGSAPSRQFPCHGPCHGVPASGALEAADDVAEVMHQISTAVTASFAL